jgi:RNA polymerase sigma-70 factor (ECF subfamily)
VTDSDLPTTYRLFVAPVRAKCRRLLGDTSAAEDATQETFVRLLRSKRPVAASTEPRVVLAWLYRTCTRISIDTLRERYRRPQESFADESSPCGVDVSAVVAARAALARIGNTTPEDELSAVVLCRIDGLIHPEAAEVLGVSERTVRRLLDRFDERMRKERV